MHPTRRFALFAERVDAPLRPPPEPDDDFEERAAILQYDGGLLRREAEEYASILLHWNQVEQDKASDRR